WIYSCNGVLGITSAIFAIFATFVLADVRLSLLGGVELYHPTFLYAYAALILQWLSHKLLSFYWILLLVLTIGDVVVGLVWVFKLDKVKLNLRPVLSREFISKYSTDELFTRTWNAVQAIEHCCGVDGPLDYDKLSQVQSQHSSNPNSSLIIDVESSLLSLVSL
ncbi:23 kDa integral membrane protein, partial [Folsomia candida]